MKKYLVGGAVRDLIIGLKPKDHDYVVVGSTPEEMLANGFKQVGNGFPVFLLDNVEYALARKDKKIGGGYNGFSFDFSPTVTLEEDLFRRDFTINAMAKDEDTGEIFDPYNGQADLKAKMIRHVNADAFADDPVRVLRAARFAARYNFDVAEETLALMADCVASEFKNLTAERVWLEFSKGADHPRFTKMIQVLDSVDAIEALGLDATEILMKLRFEKTLDFSPELKLACLYTDETVKQLEALRVTSVVKTLVQLHQLCDKDFLCIDDAEKFLKVEPFLKSKASRTDVMKVLYYYSMEDYNKVVFAVEALDNYKPSIDLSAIADPKAFVKKEKIDAINQSGWFTPPDDDEESYISTC